jgi:hypothetical protein
MKILDLVGQTPLLGLDKNPPPLGVRIKEMVHRRRPWPDT